MTVGVQELYQCQFIFQSVTNRVEDAVTNTTHWFKGGTQPDFENIRDMLTDYYNETSPGAAYPLTTYMSGRSLSGNWNMKIYRLTDDKPRAPVYTSQGNFELIDQDALPSEVALVMSFQAEPESGLPQARRRNRIYLGPFGINGNKESGRPNDSLVEAVLFSGKALLIAQDQSITWGWHVYSPTQNAHYPVASGWVDNAWDSQRRRGVEATLRGGFDFESPT
jgi:hypothetical protein